MFGVLFRYLKDKKNSFFGFTLGILLFLEMYISLFPSIRESAAQLNQLIQTYPDAFFKAFGLEKSDLAFSTIESYLATEQFSFVWPIMIVILAASFANAIAVNDIDKGTSEFVLAQPISRSKLFFSRYFAGLTLLSAFAAISVFGAIPFLKLHDISYDFSKFSNTAFLGLLFAIAVYSLATLFSVSFSEKGKASFLVGGSIIFMYVLNIISGLKDSLSDLKYLSFFYYFSPSQVLNKGNIVDWSIPVFVVFSLVAVVLAVIIFERRDVSA